MKKHSDEEMLELQSFLDGELAGGKAKAWEERLREDLDWQALAGELTWVKETIRAHEKVVPVPETRDFYWSKISAGIEAETLRNQGKKAGKIPFWRGIFLRWAVPVTLGVAALTFMILPESGGSGGSGIKQVDKSAGLPKVSLALGHEFEVPMQAPTMVFRSEKDNMTVIWVETRLDY